MHYEAVENNSNSVIHLHESEYKKSLNFVYTILAVHNVAYLVEIWMKFSKQHEFRKLHQISLFLDQPRSSSFIRVEMAAIQSHIVNFKIGQKNSLHFSISLT